MRIAVLSALTLGALLLSVSTASAFTTYWVALTPTASGGHSCAAPDFNAIQDAIDAAGNGDTIHICAGTYGSATNTDSYDLFQKNLILEGDGPDATYLEGGAQYGGNPIVAIDGSAVTLKNMTIRNNDGGEYYGGIENYNYPTSAGHLTITNVDFSNLQPTAIWDEGGGVSVTDSLFQSNSYPYGAGGAIHSAGDVDVSSSEFYDNSAYAEAYGGAILSEGVVTVDGSVFDGNSAYVGGAVASGGATTVTSSSFANQVATFDANIHSGGNLTLTDSTIADTSSYGNPGFGVTGTATVDSSTLSGLTADVCSVAGASDEITMVNSTFASNVINGPLACPTGELLAPDLSIRNSTLAANSLGTSGGAVLTATTGDLEITNSIIAQRDAGAVVGCGSSGTAVSGGGNVISDQVSSCDDFLGPGGAVTEPVLALGPLADNGGLTETMALSAGSVAIDAAVQSECPSEDQRGVSRPAGACDSGAYEYQSGVSKPKVKRKGKAGASSLGVKVRCSGSEKCKISVGGKPKSGGGKLIGRTVSVPAGSWLTVRLSYDPALENLILERAVRGGKSTAITVKARETGGGSATTTIEINLPASVTG